VLRYATPLVAAREASKGYVLLREEAETLSGPLRYLLDCYAVVFWAAISFEISSWLPDQRWIQAVYLGMLLSAFAWYLWAKRRDYQNKYLDYRALAEGLRVQLFWWLSGLKEAVADHYLRR
jgi:protein-S-isoprenylcysteine O-methyltransferase Ste14